MLTDTKLPCTFISLRLHGTTCACRPGLLQVPGSYIEAPPAACPASTTSPYPASLPHTSTPPTRLPATSHHTCPVPPSTPAHPSSCHPACLLSAPHPPFSSRASDGLPPASPALIGGLDHLFCQAITLSQPSSSVYYLSLYHLPYVAISRIRRRRCGFADASFAGHSATYTQYAGLRVELTSRASP